MTMTDTTSARSIIYGFLDTYGLGNLASWAWEKVKAGEPIEQILLEMRDTSEYKARFPAMESLAQRGEALSEAQYIDLERTYSQLSRQYGLPSGFYDQPDDFTNLITKGVSPTEYSQRLQLFQSTAFDTDPTVRSELQRLYNITPGDLTAFFIDPDRALPYLTQKVSAAEVAAASQRSGFGDITGAEAELYSMLTPAQAGQGFGSLATLREVTSELPGEAAPGMDRARTLAGVLGGNTEAQAEIQRRSAQRSAAFAGRGGFQSTRQGVSGVGSA